MSCGRTVLVFALTISGLAAIFACPGEAKAPIPLHSAIVASALPAVPFVIAADKRQQPTKTQELQFSLRSLSKDVKLSAGKEGGQRKGAFEPSCAVRLVMAERYPAKEGNDQAFDPVVLGLFKSPLQGPEPQPVAAWSVPPGTKARTAIILRSRSLCDALQPGQAEPARFLLQTSVREGRLLFFGQSDNPSEAPRLLLSYDLPDGIPGEVDWGQIRRDAAHSGRSPWRMYDPGGGFAPTRFKIDRLDGSQGALDRGDLRQSPLLYGGEIVNALDVAGLSNRYQLAARDRSGRVLSDVTVDDNQQPIPLPKFIVAGGRDRLYYFSANRIVAYNIGSGSLVRAPEPPIDLASETLLDTSTPTVGAGGSFYFATNNYVRAYSAGPQQVLLWRYQYPTQEHQVGAVALSKDETTAYILLGGTDTRLVALDAFTGDCRWQHKEPGFSITRKENETGSMPIPVVAGNDILVTSGFPTGDKLYVFHDEARTPPPPGGGVVPPAPPPPACRADKAPGGMEVRGIPGKDNHIPAAVAGPGDEAYYIKAGQLCRSLKDENCETLQCGGKELSGITLLIGDNSAGNSFQHLYGLDAVKKELFFITFSEWPQALRCNVSAPEGESDKLGPNLILAADGTLYNVGNDQQIRAIVPAALADAEQKPEFTLTADLLRTNPDTAIRVSGKITTAENLTLPPDTDLILVAGERITFGPGFTVKSGAQLRARVGLGQ